MLNNLNGHVMMSIFSETIFLEGRLVVYSGHPRGE